MPSLYDRYMSDIDSVFGWLEPTTAIMSHGLMLAQTARGIGGNIAEIGVHYGRYFILLCTGLSEGEQGIAVDLFDRQDENIDQSGNSSRATFDACVARFLDPAQVVAMEANSLRLTSTELTRHGPIRFFSVDGGHTAETTENDLRIAERAIGDAGVVALDDILNPEWTGVLTGLVNYLRNGGGLVPLALVPNKLLLAKPDWAGAYRSILRETYRRGLLRDDREFLGHGISVYGELPELQPRPRPKAVATAVDFLDRISGSARPRP